MNNKFYTLSLPEDMLANLNTIGYEQMTQIQALSLPHLLQNKDVLAQAKTGSGKTAAFGIAILQHLNSKKLDIQSLILCPTRELATQTATQLRILARYKQNIKILTLCGGNAFWPQANSLKHGAHIIVATPGRILKHLNKQTCNFNTLNTLVLDEADRMLDMGFYDDVEKIISFLPTKRQTLLFSATFTQEVKDISSKICNNAIHIEAPVSKEINKMQEIFFEIEDTNKDDALIHLLGHYRPKNVLIFCNTKIRTDAIAKLCQDNNIDALAIHGDLEQYTRDDVLVQFSNNSLRVLVATDVAARGLDIKELAMVINYDLPFDSKTYTHRIGRTARAASEGIACTLYKQSDDISMYNNTNIAFLHVNTLDKPDNFKMKPLYKTIVIEGGKKNKLRAGDILGALTANTKLGRDDIGKIYIYDRQSYVAIQTNKTDEAFKQLKHNKIKAKKFSIWLLD